MALDSYVQQSYPIACKGRNKKGGEVLMVPVEVDVKIHKSPGSDVIISHVDCPYNVGGHGQRCRASHPEVDTVEEEVRCPYSFDIPYALEIQK